jgi:hypothetical protein
MKISCNIIADLLELYADGVVSEDTKTLVETHLNDCAACRERLAGIKQGISIPAETTAKPLRFISNKIRKRFVIGYVASLVLFLALFVGFRLVEGNDPRTGLPPKTPFEKVEFIGAEIVDAPDHFISDNAILMTLANSAEGMSSHQRTNEDGTGEIHFVWYGKVSSQPHEGLYSSIIFDKPIINGQTDGESFEVVRIYYCLVDDCSYWGANRCDYSNTHLLWER